MADHITPNSKIARRPYVPLYADQHESLPNHPRLRDPTNPPIILAAGAKQAVVKGESPLIRRLRAGNAIRWA